MNEIDITTLDVKHARELIAEARAYMASNQNQHGRGGLVDQLADALAAACVAPSDEEHSRDSLGICQKCGEGINARDLVDGENPCQGYRPCGKGTCASAAGHEGECGY